MMHAAINPLMAQFLAEGEELLDAVGAQVMVLENRPGDTAAMNELFRLVHTLKGNSGLFDLPDMTRVLHAGEDLLDRVRQGQLALTQDHVDRLLAAMDHVGALFAELAMQGEISAAQSGIATDLANNLRSFLADEVEEVMSAGDAPSLLADAIPPEALALGASLGKALHFLRLTPDPECFFRGEDPFHTARQTPGLVWHRITGADQLPLLGELDPYRCVLSFDMVSEAPLEEIRQHFQYGLDQLAIHPLVAQSAACPPQDPDAAVLQQVLHAQRAILLQDHDRPWRKGALQAVARVLANVATMKGGAIEDIDGACQTAIAGQTGPMLAIIDRLSGEKPAPPAEEPVEIASLAGSRSLRVDQGKIDRLMGLIGEMVVARNALPFLAQRAETVYGSRDMAREIKAQHAVINRVTEEMQDAIMQIRMMPVSVVVQRFPRLVRDVARKLGKQVDLVLEGEDTEADKAIIEALGDPLVHMVRNSLDHGLEAPDDRIAAGKPAQGRLTIRAHQEGDRIVLDIIDDGRGIDPARIRAKAVEKGLVTADAAAAMSDHDAIQLIFAAGFSTAEAVSDLSGRGVGRGAVHTPIQMLHGDVALSSTKGEGTHLRITLPLSMAVTRVLVLEAAGQLFAMPVDMVVETTRLAPSDIRGIKTERTILRRNRILPIRELNKLLGVPKPARVNDDGEQSLLVARLGDEVVALIVDGFRETLDVIQKPLTGVLAGIPAFSGSTLMGDGSVLLVLNPRMLL